MANQIDTATYKHWLPRDVREKGTDLSIGLMLKCFDQIKRREGVRDVSFQRRIQRQGAIDLAYFDGLKLDLEEEASTTN